MSSASPSYGTTLVSPTRKRAAASPRDQREPLWQRAVETTDAFVEQYPNHPRLPLVELQGALALLARGELARQEAELTADAQPLFEEARTSLRAATSRLESLLETTESRPNFGDRSAVAQLAPDARTALARNVRYQLARARRNQAQCYPPASADRANSLTEAVKLLGPLAGLDDTNPLVWKSRLDLAAAYRLLGDPTTARRLLDALAQRDPPPEVRLRAQAERIRLALDTGRLEEAVDLLREGRQMQGAVSPELDYAWLETYLAAMKAAEEAKRSDQAAAWRQKAAALVEQIERRHGPYWTRRAGMLLARHLRMATGTGEIDTLVRVAASAYRTGRLDDAVAGYDRAQAAAAAQGDRDRAFELGYTAAAIEHKRERHETALDRFRRLALAASENPKAAEAHRLAIYHAAQLAKASPGEALDRYVELLREHAAAWPDEPRIDDVLRQLGKMAAYRRDYAAAVEAYRAIPREAINEETVEQAAQWYEAWLDGLNHSGKPTEPLAAGAAEWFESLMVGPDGRLPARFGPVARAAALAAARLRLRYTPAGYAQAEAVLSTALDSAPDAPPDWRSTAQAMLVCALAGRGRREEAAALLARISTGPPAQLFSMLEGLARTAADAPPEVRRELAELQLRTIEMLGGDAAGLSDQQRRKLTLLRAQALAEAGRREAALSAYQTLARQHPRNAAIQEAYAALLASRDDRDSLHAALQRWRQLQRHLPEGSPRWFRAKYAVAELHCRMGDKQQARKMLDLLALLHPELGGPELKPQFDALRRRCGR